MMHTEMVR